MIDLDFVYGNPPPPLFFFSVYNIRLTNRAEEEKYYNQETLNISILFILRTYLPVSQPYTAPQK